MTISVTPPQVEQVEQWLLELSASLLAGGVAELLQQLPGSGQQLTKLSKHNML